MKIVLIWLIIALNILLYSPQVRAAETVDGTKLFSVHCAGCHPQGGNIIRRGKTLKSKALARNKMDSLAAIKEIVTHGKNNMSAFEERLSEREIEAVAIYVLQQAENNWQ